MQKIHSLINPLRVAGPFGCSRVGRDARVIVDPAGAFVNQRDQMPEEERS